MVPQTRNGKTHLIPAQVEVPATPRPPVDWERVTLVSVIGIAAAMTLISIAWSTVSIGSLLGGGIGYGAAAVYDLSWGVVVGLEYLGRYDAARRSAAQKGGVVLLIVTMAAIATHGFVQDNTALALCGAGVSLIAKAMWVAVMAHVHRELSPADAGWVQAEQSEVYAEMAIGNVRRQSARARARAAAQILAAERMYGGPAAVVHHDVVEPEPESADVIERAAVDQLRARAIASTHGYGPEWHEASAAADLSMQAAMDAGHPARTVLEEVERYRSAVRPEGSGTPEPDPFAEVTGRGRPVPLRAESTDVPDEPEPDHGKTGDSPRVPEQRPPNLRTGVHTLYALGVRDPDEIHGRLSAVLPGDVSRESVSRYVREARAAAGAAPQPGTGLYN